MSPFIAIAGSILPEILKIVARKKNDPSIDAVSDAVEQAVKTATKKDEAAEANKIIEKDPQVAADLRVRLAEIAAEQEQEDRAAAEKKLQLELERLEVSHAQEMDRLNANLAARESKRKADIDELNKRLADVQSARAAFEKLALGGSKFAWAPPVISTIIVLGFFSILVVMLTANIPALNPETPGGERLFQIINIVVGALTAAFATVVSFWLGSSQGSKQKDLNNLTVETQRVAVEERREERLLQKATRVPPAGQPEASPAVSTPQPPRRKLANESNFIRLISDILEAEGGFVDHPKDPGGATNMGITINTLKAWRAPDPVSVDDVRNLTEEEAKQIYRANYWNALSCDDLPSGVDLVVFDFGVNAGPARSGKLLQRVVGVNPDGVIGPITKAAIAAVSPEHIIRRFGALRLEYYQGLPHFPTFGKGWTRRVHQIEERALSLVET